MPHVHGLLRTSLVSSSTASALFSGCVHVLLVEVSNYLVVTPNFSLTFLTFQPAKSDQKVRYFLAEASGGTAFLRRRRTGIPRRFSEKIKNHIRAAAAAAALHGRYRSTPFLSTIFAQIAWLGAPHAYWFVARIVGLI